MLRNGKMKKNYKVLQIVEDTIMKTKITESEQNITLADIQNFEKEFEVTMPENLKKIYLKYNGGILGKILMI